MPSETRSAVGASVAASLTHRKFGNAYRAGPLLRAQDRSLRKNQE